MKKEILFIAIGLAITALTAINFIHSSNWQNEKTELNNKYETLQTQYEVLYDNNQENEKLLQEAETSLMIFNKWAEEDGYKDDVEGWWKAIQQCRDGYTDADKKFAETESINYASEEQKQEIQNLVNQINSCRNLKELRQLTSDFNELTEEINRQKNTQVYGEEIVTSDAYNWNYNSDTSYVGANNSSELTPSSGVNYCDGRTETYYSSNVLYHYKTPEWTLDSEGYYHDENGNYVVAASDIPQGTTFEGSKGTCVVLDSGCSPGVTDYYVAW